MTHERPLIFLTNDDGIQSPGLHALAEAIGVVAEIKIIAPSNQQTAAGRGLNGSRDTQLQVSTLVIDGNEVEAYHNDCSPAQVVLQGIQVFGAERSPDLLISGINYGENLGRDITMSGTVGAAIQAASMGIPALAVSLQVPIEYHYFHGDDVDWSIAGHFAQVFALKMLNRTMPDDVDLLKIDIPSEASRNTPWKVTRVSRQSYFTARIDSPSLNSRLSDSVVNVQIDRDKLEKDSDIHTIMIDRNVSVAPVSLDMSSRLDRHKFHEYMNHTDE